MEEEKSLRGRTLRSRRLSVELSDETKSPSAPSTPTKKRGRLATKPLLDNIDENAVVSSPKRTTRKSIVSESTDDRPLTPARRNTRIKSNTSITAEITQSYESPRALRAARRNSLAGSDTETGVTPVRATRRNRKDSSSSVENMGEAAGKLNNTLGVVVEEIDKTTANNETSRKSPIEKKDNDEIQLDIVNDKSATPLSTKTVKDENVNVTINSCDPVTTNINTPTLNKSTSKELNESQDTIEKQKLTRTLNHSPVPTRVSPRLLARRSRENSSDLKIDVQNLSPNEKTKSRRKKSKEHSNDSTNENELNESTNVSNFVPKDVVVVLSSMEKSKQTNNEIVDPDVSNHDSPKVLNKNRTTDEKNTNLNCDSPNISSESDKVPPVNLEDTDSNGEQNGLNRKESSEDQCVPIVVEPEIMNTDLDKSVKIANTSCEPMDVDETLPENISLKVIDKDNSKQNNSFNKSKEISKSQRKISLSDLNDSKQTDNDKPHNSRKSTPSKSTVLPDPEASKSRNYSLRNSSVVNAVNTSTNSNISSSKTNSPNVTCSSNVKKRHSSLSSSSIHEKSSNENKSTLILSQLKNNSSNDVTSNTDNIKSNLEDITNKNIADNTPLKHKKIQQIGMKTSTPNVDNINKEKNEHKSKSDTKDCEESSQEESDEEETQSDNFQSFLCDEAEEANDSYESGDSRDEDEKKYEKENEIVEKGETLSTEDTEGENSDDEYEKDSFIVSSCEDDDDLLSGSGDDLNMSDNELNMTAKSKRKYDERKDIERKKASREMYEARHNIKNDSENSEKKIKKKNRLRIDSTTDTFQEESFNKSNKNNRSYSVLDSSSDEIKVGKNKKRLKLDSTTDTIDEETTKRNNIDKSKESNEISNNAENEMIILEDNISNEKDPLSNTLQVKTEPQTPQNISSVNFTVRQEIEVMDVDENASMIPNVSTEEDPLENNEMTESDSDDEVIKQKYENVLNILNGIGNSKSAHNSLNLDKKSKSKNPALVDELNLTQVKEKKSDMKQKSSGVESSDDSSSSTLNLEDFFSKYTESDEENDETESNNKSLDKKPETTKNQTLQDFPIKDVTDANTSISKNKIKTLDMKDSKESDEISTIKDTSLTDKNPKKKIKSAKDTKNVLNQSLGNEKSRKQNSKLHKSALDTPYSMSFIESPKNKTKEKHRFSEHDIADITSKDDGLKTNITEGTENKKVQDEPTPNKSKKKKLSISEQNSTEQNDQNGRNNNLRTSLNESTNIKKQKKHSLSDEDESTILNESTNKNMRNCSISEQNQSIKNLNESTIAQDEPNQKMNDSITNKKKKDSLSKQDSIPQYRSILINESSKNDQNDYSLSEKDGSNSLNNSVTNKKKKKHSLSEQDQTIINMDESMAKKKYSLSEQDESSSNIYENTNKKKKKLSLSEQENTERNQSLININESITKKKHSLSEQDEPIIENLNKKKKKHSLSEQSSTEQDHSIININDSITNKKTKKHSLSEQSSTEQDHSIMNKKNKKHSLSEQNQSTININDPITNKKKKKHSLSEQSSTEHNQSVININDSITNKKKKHSLSKLESTELAEPILMNSNKSKKKKHSLSEENVSEPHITDINSSQEKSIAGDRKKKKKSHEDIRNEKLQSLEYNNESATKKQRIKESKLSHPESFINNSQEKKNKKRKVIDNEDVPQNKIFKEHLRDNVKVKRLPQEILDQLGNHPSSLRKEIPSNNVTSTTEFNVEQIRNKRSKPSEYLEESIHLEFPKPKKDLKIKRPKILPTVPSACISSFGFTTNFKINVLNNSNNPFSQISEFKNFKQESLYSQRIKRMTAHDKCKKLRSIKLSKF